MFKKKSKKSAAAPLPPQTTNDDLEDDLFAQLDAQEQSALTLPANGTPTSATTLATMTSAESNQSTKLQKPKKDSKLRFKAREVSVQWQFTKTHIPITGEENAQDECVLKTLGCRSRCKARARSSRRRARYQTHM